ncbi:hypothetical protein ACJMK2_029240 [Sinanodonta woodiana]|uniref:Cadherin domain-containing protein n=1 Tax=Sinanodonta woodiana TaxID=1069815 RepID=A0ABD3XD73_SINWO
MFVNVMTTNAIHLFPGSGIITATKTMSGEFTNTYYLTVRVADRRSTASTTCPVGSMGFGRWGGMFLAQNIFTMALEPHNVTSSGSHLSKISYFSRPSKSSTFTLYKKSCNSPGCGVICDTNGCLDHDVTTSYVIGITCYDGYGSSDSGTFTMYVRQNDPPIFTNLPNSITINTDIIARGDVLFTIYYTDTENENLRYNYTYNGVVGHSLFYGDTYGNYYNNAANITAIADQWDLSNASFSVYICGSERRNTVCGTLTIHIRDYCATSPVCNSATTTVTDRFAVGGTLFTISVPNRASLSGTQSYTVYSEHNYFTVSSTGVIKTTASLPAIYPSTRYYINARVYDTAACLFAYCQFQVDVTFTNDPIYILNLGSSAVVSIHEDTVLETTLYTIQTSDATVDDSVTCNVTSSTPSTSVFKIKETYPGSDVYQILSKAYPGFAHDTCNQYVIKIECWDSYGSRTNGSLTVNIVDNQSPVFTNLAASTSITVDSATVFAGTSIFTVTTTDAENDNLFYNYTIYNQWTPFNMSANAVVSLHRNVSIPEENGAAYWMYICVYDLHNRVCGNLTVTFTPSKTRPIISNLPAAVAVLESLSSGSTIFIVSVTDPDIGDIHNFSMSVTPASSTSKFSLNSLTGLLSLASGQMFDYETLSFYQITFSVRDQYLAARQSKIINISITDVNEAPYFVSIIPDITFGEGKAGKVVGTPSIQCKDPDTADVLTFSITGPYQTYFNMNGTTGKLTLANDWDLESGQATSTYLTVYCIDHLGLQAATNLTVNIIAVNEFAPVLSLSTAGINLTDQTQTTEILLNVTATDQDYGDDNCFLFHIIGFGFGSKYFKINGTGNLGQLSLSQQIKLKYAFNATFTVTVSDNETSPLVSPVIVTIYYTPTPPDPQKPPSYCTLCTTEGIAVVSILAIEGFAIFMIIAYVILKYSRPIYATTPAPMASMDQPPVIEQKEQEFDTISQKSVESNISESSEISTDSEISDTSSGSDASSFSSYSL